MFYNLEDEFYRDRELFNRKLGSTFCRHIYLRYMNSNTLGLLLISICSLNVFCQNETPYKAGFMTLQLQDSSRFYKPNTAVSDQLHYRPLDLDIWYPASRGGGKPMLFEDLYRLHEERANKYQDEEDYTGFSDEFIYYLAAGFGVEAKDGKRLLKVRSHSYKNAIPADEKFPLVIYMAGYNGMGWESYRLLEQLAENGFVVLSISSIGRYPGDMTNALADTMEQVYDAEFALQALKDRKGISIDFEKIGVLGLSWGGMSGILLLDKHPEFKAMVSLDGSDIFYYGDTEQDDTFLTEIYNADLLHPEKTTAAFFHIEAGDRLDEFTPTGEYHYYKKIASPKWYMRYTESKHEDFASIAWALKTSGEQVASYEQILNSTVLFFREQLQQKGDFETYYKQLLKKVDKTNQPFNYSKKKSEELVLAGKIQDLKSRESLSYVNIGVLHKEIGTVSSKDGQFELKLSKSNERDTLRISRIGYEPQTLQVKRVINQDGQLTIKLKEEIAELNEVVVTARKWKKKTLGNKTKSTFIGHLFYYEQLGKEMGIRMNAGRRPNYVDAFNFHISYNRFSAKSLFRLNMYNIENGKPAENILKDNIILAIAPKQTGMISINLKEYDIVLTEDVIVTLEWIDTEGQLNPTEALVVSVGLFTGGTYERNSKESKMRKKLKGMGLGYTLDVRY